jgi:hypothetical protein
MSFDDWFGLGFVLFCWGTLVVGLIASRELRMVVRSIPGEMLKRLEAWAERNRRR